MAYYFLFITLERHFVALYIGKLENSRFRFFFVKNRLFLLFNQKFDILYSIRKYNQNRENMKSRIITYLALYLSNKFENLFYSGGETTETSSDDEGPLQNIPAAQPQIQQPQRRPRYVKI